MYLTAAVCEDGHALGATFRPGQLPPKHCKHDGKRVYTKCPYCNAPIKGVPSSSVSSPGWKPPKYCEECAEPYPWTQTDFDRTKREFEQRAAEIGVSQADVAIVMGYADEVAAGTATEEKACGVRATMQKVGSVALDLFEDFAARCFAYMVKP